MGQTLEKAALRAVDLGALDIEAGDLFEYTLPEDDVIEARAADLADLVIQKVESKGVADRFKRIGDSERSKQAYENYDRARKLQNSIVAEYGQAIVSAAHRVLKEREIARKERREALRKD